MIFDFFYNYLEECFSIYQTYHDEALIDFLNDKNPDIVLLQELKCTTDAFPYLEIEALGYNIAVHGQKTYNGVAILSKYPLEDITKNIFLLERLSANFSSYESSLTTASLYLLLICLLLFLTFDIKANIAIPIFITFNI